MEETQIVDGMLFGAVSLGTYLSLHGCAVSLLASARRFLGWRWMGLCVFDQPALDFMLDECFSR